MSEEKKKEKKEWIKPNKLAFMEKYFGPLPFENEQNKKSLLKRIEQAREW